MTALDLQDAIGRVKDRLRRGVAGETAAEDDDVRTILDAASVLTEPLMLHLNMLRGGVAKLTPAHIGHLYRGVEALNVVAEVKRQNPEAFPSWRPMADAPHDARLLAKTHPDIYPRIEPERPDLASCNDLRMVIKKEPVMGDYDPGWRLVGPFGRGGFSEAWFVGWTALPD